uniref:Uncharacterized protein n=1 Tax=Anguilla anguilla TaxID=7936 RepID=A0A0E9QI87_ANGAN
MAAYSLGSYV